MENNTGLSPRGRKAGNNITLLYNITKIGTKGAMETHKKTLHELPPRITQEATEGFGEERGHLL
jgi:hypothetical protein